MKIKRLSEDALLPVKAHAGDLGYDLFASEDTILYPGETTLIPTGVAIQFPDGYGALIRDRSSVATKRNLFVVAGVIDNGYVGEIMIALHNATNSLDRISVGEKIAQIILIPTVNFVVEEVSELISADARGVSGFGSTGT